MKNFKKLLTQCFLIVCSLTTINSFSGGVVPSCARTCSQAATNAKEAVIELIENPKEAAKDPLFWVGIATTGAMAATASYFGLKLPPAHGAIPTTILVAAFARKHKRKQRPHHTAQRPPRNHESTIMLRRRPLTLSERR